MLSALLHSVPLASAAASASATPLLSPSPAPLLSAAVALILWTLVMEAWLYATRIPAMQRLKVVYDPRKHSPSDFNARMPPTARWVADNYNHLHEQPVLFYALCATLALLGAGGAEQVGTVRWAWTYVALRVAHSFAQVFGNNVMLRFSLFILSSMVVAVLAAKATALTILA